VWNTSGHEKDLRVKACRTLNFSSNIIPEPIEGSFMINTETKERVCIYKNNFFDTLILWI
jgi:hypothetical protein